MISCLIDTIAFSLQKAGGVQIVWKELIERMIDDDELDLKFLQYKNALNNIHRQELKISQEQIINKRGRALKYWKFINPFSARKTEYIFHSSVYRVDLNPHAKNITTVHDFAYERFSKGLQKWAHCREKYYAIRHSEAILCISESSRSDLFKYLPDIDESKVHVVYNGVSGDYKVLSRSEYKITLPFDDKGYILYVGGRGMYKNFDVVVRTCGLLKVPLVIAGGSKLNNDEICYLDTALGRQYYRVYGNVSGAILNELYNRALLLLYSSMFEGFGIPIVEAQKAGCPVIGLNISSIPEIMGDTDFCLKDTSEGSIADAARIILRNPNIARAEREKGLINAERFSWDKTYLKVKSVYRKLLNV